MKKPTKVEAQMQLFRRLDFAIISFRQARDLCVHLQELWISPDSNRPGASLYSACMTGIVVSYALPFGANEGLGSLPSRYREKFANAAMAGAHNTMLRIRHTVYAHRALAQADQFTIDDDSYPKLYTSRIEIRASESGEGARVRSNPVLPDVSETCLPRIAALLDFQIERLGMECEEILVKLANGKAYKPGTYTVGVDFP